MVKMVKLRMKNQYWATNESNPEEGYHSSLHLWSFFVVSLLVVFFNVCFPKHSSFHSIFYREISLGLNDFSTHQNQIN